MRRGDNPSMFVRSEMWPLPCSPIHPYHNNFDCNAVLSLQRLQQVTIVTSHYCTQCGSSDSNGSLKQIHVNNCLFGHQLINLNLDLPDIGTQR